MLEEDASRTFIAEEEKAMPGFKTSKDWMTLSLEANATANFQLKPVLISIMKILGPLRITLNLLYLGSLNGIAKPL